MNIQNYPKYEINDLAGEYIYYNNLDLLESLLTHSGANHEPSIAKFAVSRGTNQARQLNDEEVRLMKLLKCQVVPYETPTGPIPFLRSIERILRVPPEYPTFLARH